MKMYSFNRKSNKLYFGTLGKVLTICMFVCVLEQLKKLETIGFSSLFFFSFEH